MAQVVPPEIARDWPFEVRPLTPVFGAEILGIDLDQAASPEIFPAIHAAWLRYQVLAFRGLEVSPATQVAFAANFGEVQVHVMNQYQGETDHPELYVLSNLDEDGKPSGKHPDQGTLKWHTDGSWNARSGHSTFMYAEQPPKAGGETHFGTCIRPTTNWPLRGKRGSRPCAYFTISTSRARAGTATSR